jgi:hypothetical protein
VNVLPVDVAWMGDPDVVIAVKVGAARERRLPQLDWRVTGRLSRLGGLIPNPATAKMTLELHCRDCFERDPDAYRGGGSVILG